MWLWKSRFCSVDVRQKFAATLYAAVYLIQVLVDAVSSFLKIVRTLSVKAQGGAVFQRSLFERDKSRGQPFRVLLLFQLFLDIFFFSPRKPCQHDISFFIHLLFFKYLFIWLRCVSVAVQRRLHCYMRVQLPCSMWDLSSLTRIRTHIPCIGRQVLNHLTTREVPSSVYL